MSFAGKYPWLTRLQLNVHDEHSQVPVPPRLPALFYTGNEQRMLGLWARSCQRPPVSVFSKGFNLQLGITRNYHVEVAFNIWNQKFRDLRTSSLTRLPARRFNSTQSTPPSPTPPSQISKPTPKRSLLSRFMPSSLTSKDSNSSSSFGKIMSLAKPEWKPLTMAISLLLVSSAVSMSVPFTIGKLIDFFSTTNPVSNFIIIEKTCRSILSAQQIPFGLSVWQASGGLMLLFTLGATANAGRAILMRLSGKYFPLPSMASSELIDIDNRSENCRASSWTNIFRCT